VLSDLDLLLVMSVNPGFSGQQFIASSLDKIGRARRLLDNARAGAVLQVDGGINRETIGDVWRAGADTFVAGNAVFGSKDPRAEVAALRARCAQLA
jgi:ribulose-phosphate 3-epimerase